MYKIKVTLRSGEEVIKTSDKGSRVLVLRTFAEAAVLARNGAIVKVVVREPSGRVTKHTFKNRD